MGDPMNDYVQKLNDELKKSGAEEEYIALCTGYAERLLGNNVPVIFDFKHLALLLGYSTSEIAVYVYAPEELFYNQFNVQKRNGGYRIIDAPSDKLKNIQRWILKNILNNIEIHEACIGFKKGKSIYDNAKLHVGKECVLNMDLKDFFPSIKQESVFNIFRTVGYTKKVSFYLSKMLTRDGVLPQGSPASPMASNIVAKHLDIRLYELAKKYKADYSRYADDLTFSGSKSVKNMIPIIEKIVKEENLTINDKKTRYAYYYQRQEVTGLIVNKKVSVPKEYIKEIYKDIYYCKKYGVSSHLNRVNNEKSFYKEYMYGKALFVKMVDLKQGQKILNELDSLDWDY